MTLDLEERAKITSGFKSGCSGHCTSYGTNCENGGQCVEKYHGYSCDCSHTAYDGTFCNKGKAEPRAAVRAHLPTLLTDAVSFQLLASVPALWRGSVQNYSPPSGRESPSVPGLLFNKMGGEKQILNSSTRGTHCNVALKYPRHTLMVSESEWPLKGDSDRALELRGVWGSAQWTGESLQELSERSPGCQHPPQPPLRLLGVGALAGLPRKPLAR